MAAGTTGGQTAPARPVWLAPAGVLARVRALIPARELVLLRRHWRLPLSLGLLLAVLLELAAGGQRPGRLRLGLLGIGLGIYAAWLARTTARLYSIAEDERARLEAVIAYSPAGILLFDQETQQITANAAAEVLLGLPAGAGLERQKLNDVIRTPEGARPAPEELPWARALSGATLYNQEALIIRADGSTSHVLVNAAPLSRSGRVSGAIVVLQDISALKDLERQREEFISVVAHDLRSPLALIRGYADLIRKLPAGSHGGEQEQRALAYIQEAVTRLDRVVGDLLDMSRIEARRLELHKEPLDLVALVREVVERDHLLLAGHPVRVVVDAPTALVEADRGRLEQVLMNLLSNAGKYATPGSEVIVRVQVLNGHARVSVTNHAEPIPPEHLARLFTRFYRTPQAQHLPGLGLGLYIAKGLIEAHGGTMHVESSPDGLITFWFALPLMRTPPPVNCASQ